MPQGSWKSVAKWRLEPRAPVSWNPRSHPCLSLGEGQGGGAPLTFLSHLSSSRPCFNQPSAAHPQPGQASRGLVGSLSTQGPCQVRILRAGATHTAGSGARLAEARGQPQEPASERQHLPVQLLGTQLSEQRPLPISRQMITQPRVVPKRHQGGRSNPARPSPQPGLRWVRKVAINPHPAEGKVRHRGMKDLPEATQQ